MIEDEPAREEDDGSSTHALGRLFAADDEAGGLSERNAAARVRAALLGAAANVPGLARYRLRRVLGEGAMGQVWLADDPDLSRAVAIKLVRAQAGDRSVVHAQRLAREARAMARISHPNVIQIFDVGTHGDDTEVFIVMEYVDGDTLGHWFTSAPSWRAVVNVFMQAGAGLDAAHRAGLVHRDFKPANVLIGRDGRVRVADFGLARTDHEARRAYATAALEEDLSITQGASLTESGAVVGTPLYMSPEQHAGGDIDVRSDQYSYCVALYEGLSGRRPFSGRLTDVARAKATRELAPPSPKRRIPEAVLEVVMRGLEPDPARRWPSMAALMAALRRATTPKRRYALLGASVVAVIGATALARPRPPECSAGDITWDDASQQRLEAALLESVGADAAARAAERLEDFAVAWRERAADVCDRTVRDAALCMREVGKQFDTTVALLADGDPQALARALRVIEELPSAARCDDAGAGETTAGDLEPAALAMRDDLAKGAAVARAGDLDQALALLGRVRDRAQAPGSARPDVATRAAFEIGYAYIHVGRAEEGVPWLRTAYFEARAEGDDVVALESVPGLVTYEANRRDFGAAEEWLRHADALSRRRPPSLIAKRMLANARSSLAANRGDLVEAAAGLREVMALAQAQHSDLGWLAAASNLAMVLFRGGQLDETLSLRRAIVERTTAIYGGDATETAHARVQYAEALARRDRRAAIAEVRAAESILERSGSAAEAALATAYFVECDTLSRLREFDAAVVAGKRAVELLERIDPTNLGRRATYLSMLGTVRGEAGDVEGASRDLTAALSVLGDEPVYEAAVALLNRSYVLDRAGRFDEAAADARRGRGVVRALDNVDDDLIASSYLNEAAALRDGGRCAEALVLLDEAATWMRATPGQEDAAVAVDGPIAVAMSACGRQAEAILLLTAARARVTPGSRDAGYLAVAHARVLGPGPGTERAEYLAAAEAIGEAQDDSGLLTEVADERRRDAVAATPSH